MPREFDSVLFSGILACLGGVYALVTGWVMMRSPDKMRPMYFKLAIGISRLFQGSIEASRREAKLMNPVHIRRHGFLRILTGGLLMVSGCLQLLALLLMV